MPEPRERGIGENEEGLKTRRLTEPWVGTDRAFLSDGF